MRNKIRAPLINNNKQDIFGGGHRIALNSISMVR
jgi:hypothetical protein